MDQGYAQRVVIEKILADYPNVAAIYIGCISGSFREWPMVKGELRKMLAAWTDEKVSAEEALLNHGTCLAVYEEPVPWVDAAGTSRTANRIVEMTIRDVLSTHHPTQSMHVLRMTSRLEVLRHYLVLHGGWCIRPGLARTYGKVPMIPDSTEGE